MPRGITNNNPGNIRYIPAITSEFLGCTGEDTSGFCVFSSSFYGIRALALTLYNYQKLHGIDTVTATIMRWAPPSENNTTAYIADVCQRTKYKPLQKLNFSMPAVLGLLTVAIIWHENGIQPYNGAQIAAGVNAALGVQHETVANTDDGSGTGGLPVSTNVIP